MSPDREFLHADLGLRAIGRAAEGHKHCRSTDRRVEHLDQTALRSDIGIKQVVYKFSVEVAAFHLAEERISGLHGLYSRLGEMWSTGRVDKLAAEICHNLSVAEEPHASGIGHVGHMSHLYVLLMAIAHEFLHVLGFDNRRHALLAL